MKYFLLLLGIAAVSTGFALQESQRVRRQVPLARALTYPPGTQRTADGVPILRLPYKDSRSQSGHTDEGLTLYKDFVNDPWVPTEGLGDLLAQRHGGSNRNRELRTGYQSLDNRRDNLWQPESHGQNQHANAGHSRQDYRTGAAQSGTGYGEEGNAWWEVSSRSGDHITYTRRGQSTSSTSNTNAQEERTRSLGSTNTQQRTSTNSFGSTGWRQPAPAGQVHTQSSSAIRTEVSRVPAANWRTSVNSVQASNLGRHGHGQAHTGSHSVSKSSSSSWTSESNQQTLPYGEEGDDTWVVASRSDDHVTYKKRNQGGLGQHERIVNLGNGDGKVLARVINTGGNSAEQAFTGVHGNNFRSGHSGGTQQLASYKSMRSHYAHSGYDGVSENPNMYRQGVSEKPSIQLKSGDFVSYRNPDGSEVVYPRFRDSGNSARHYGSGRAHVQPTLPTVPTVPQEFEREGDWRVVSKDDSHITWTRIGSDLERNPAAITTRQLHSTHGHGAEARTTHVSTGPRPVYPMMYEKETAEKQRRLGATNVLAY